MGQAKQPDKTAGLENLSVNSARRSGTREDGTGNPARKDKERNSIESTRVPDQQVPSKP